MPEENALHPTDSDKRVLLSGRVRESVRKRMKVYAAQQGINMQDLLDEALDEYLTRHGG